MALFEVEYSYDEPTYGTVIVDAKDIEEAEYIALRDLRETLGEDAFAINIEQVQEVKKNA